MATTPGDAPRVSRRTVLLSVAGVIIGAGELALSIDDRSTAPPSAAAELVGTTVPSQTTTNVVATSAHGTPVSTRIPAWAKPWNTPVHDLEDFLKRSPGTNFPPQSVMMTVDDGPTAMWTPRYLDLFAKYEVKATFNMIGAQVTANKALVAAMVSEGHSLSNHTWTHDLRLPHRSVQQIRAEIDQTNDAIDRATGVRPKIFRSPGGNWGPNIFEALAEERMLPLDWDIDPRDWSRPGVGHIENSMLQASPGNIILCHDGGGDRSQTYAALQAVLPVLKDRGLSFVTLPLNG